jgi:hypothetical protein
MRIRIVGEIQKEQLSIDEVVGNLQEEGLRASGCEEEGMKTRRKKRQKPTMSLKFSKH